MEEALPFFFLLEGCSIKMAPDDSLLYPESPRVVGLYNLGRRRRRKMGMREKRKGRMWKSLVDKKVGVILGPGTGEEGWV